MCVCVCVCVCDFQCPEEKSDAEENSDASKSEISLVYEIALKRNMPVNFEVRHLCSPRKYFNVTFLLHSNPVLQRKAIT